MKYRNGWVSNSSTTSFVIMGMDFPGKLEDISNLDFSDGKQIAGLKDIWTDAAIDIFRDTDWDRDSLDHVLEENFGIVLYEDDEEGPVIGTEVEIKDDQTWGEYREEVYEKLRKVLISPRVPGLVGGSYHC